MKQKILPSIFIFLFLSLNLVSCVPGGTQPARGWAGVNFYDGILYVSSMDGKIVAVNPTTRSIEWSYTVSAPSGGMSCSRTSSSTTIYGTPAVDNDFVYVGAYSGKIYALNKANGRERWVYPKEGYMASIVASPVIADDTIYFSSSDGSIYALDTTYGEFRWIYESPSEEKLKKLWTTPVIAGDTVYLSTFEGYIYSLSVEDGSLLPWTFEADIGFASSLVLYQDTIFIGTFDNNLYAIKVGDSEPIWKFSGNKWFWATPVVKDGIVYAGCLDGKIYAIDAKAGNLEWEFDTGSPIVSPPIWDDGVLVVASESGDVFVFDTVVKPSGQTMKPIRTISTKVLIRAPLHIQEGVVYIHAQNDLLYVVDINEGEIIWELPLAGEKGA